MNAIFPLPSRARALWPEASEAEWNDWRWQLRQRVSTADELARVVVLRDEEREALERDGLFRVDLTPFVASLVDPDDPGCPIRRQIVPTIAEAEAFDGVRVDSLGEDAHSPVPGLVHRYPDRVLMLVTTECASYCRFCTRSRIVGDASENFGPGDHQQQLEYIASRPEVRDVLLSGGDPLMLPDRVLDRLLERLRAIPHVEIVRIGTRVPYFLPQRITPELCAILARHHPLWVNVHVNHPNELVPEVNAAYARLADAGIPLGAQTVLMAGVNDCPQLMLALVRALVRQRIRPYYLYQCDLVRGAGHFRTRLAAGMEIAEALRGHTSGYAVPTFVVDLPEGGGKVPVAPSYLISQGVRRVALRNFEGFIGTYVEPEQVPVHDPSTCRFCSARAGGVSALLRGDQASVKPSGWHEGRGG